jgi:hypothetical protein
MYDVSPARRVEVLTIGRDRSPIICIDGFSTDPAGLVEQACSAPFIDNGTSYPGVRAPVPEAYSLSLFEATAPLIERVFGAPPDPELEMCAFSMVTTDPSDLQPIQRIPHYDGRETHRIAFLHYLCDAFQGGTSFYRHRASGFEHITPANVDTYLVHLSQELRQGASRGYMPGETSLYERTHKVEAARNRLVIYRGNALHCSDINARTVLGEDPREGRLTINGFGFLIRETSVRDARPAAE